MLPATEPPARPPSRPPPTECPPTLTAPIGIKRDKLAGEKQTMIIAPIPRIIRKSVPMGSVPHPSALAVNWFDSFMATPIMNSKIGRAKIAPSATPIAIFRRRRPFSEVT